MNDFEAPKLAEKEEKLTPQSEKKQPVKIIYGGSSLMNDTPPMEKSMISNLNRNTSMRDFENNFFFCAPPQQQQRNGNFLPTP